MQTLLVSPYRTKKKRSLRWRRASSQRYPGQMFDAESGLHYNRNRDYESGTGRYIQPDPIGFMSGDTSNYAYVSSDPMNWIDPSGLASKPSSGSGNYSPGAGGNSAQRRSATRDFLRGAAGQAPPDLLLPKPYEREDGALANPASGLTPVETACKTVGGFGLDLCGPGAKFGRRCVSWECRQPVTVCDASNPTGAEWRDPGVTVSSPSYRRDKDPNCRCKRSEYFDRY